MPGIWVSETEYIDFERQKKSELSSAIATRERAVNWWTGFNSLLPDPDPVLRKLGQDQRIYKQLLADAHIGSCYESRKAGALSCKWEIEEADRGSVRANRRAADICKDLFGNLDVNQILEDALEAPFYGYSPLEIMWDSINGSWLPVEVSGRPPEWFKFDMENKLRFLAKGVWNQDAWNQGEELPEKKFLLARHRASYENPYGQRVLSRCFWPQTFKKGGFKFWVSFTEKYGMPFLVGKAPPGTHETERNRVLSQLTAMARDAVAVINNDESIDILEAGGKTGSAEIYERLVRICDEQISKAILGQTLTTEVADSGSRALGDVHQEVRQDLVESDKRMVAAEINKLLRWVTEFNASGAEPPKFKWIEAEDIQADRAERDGKLHNMGASFTRDYFMRTYNFEKGDLEDKQEAPAPAEDPLTGKADVSRGDDDDKIKAALEGRDKVDRIIDETFQ